jgi:hypothetical protein
MRNKQAAKLCIAPDLFEAWPHDLRAMFSFALHPQPREWLDELWQKGRRDAARFAVAAGLARAADPLSLLPGRPGALEEAGEGAAAAAAEAAAAAGQVVAGHQEPRQLFVQGGAPGEFEEEVGEGEGDAAGRPGVEAIAAEVRGLYGAAA